MAVVGFGIVHFVDLLVVCFRFIIKSVDLVKNWFSDFNSVSLFSFPYESASG